MSRKNFWQRRGFAGAAAAAAMILFGMLAAGCGSSGGGSGVAGPAGPDDTPVIVRLNGTWDMEDGTVLVLNDSSFEASAPYDGRIVRSVKGTYLTSGDSITLTPTHIHGEIVNVILAEYRFPRLTLELQWYTLDELKTALRRLFGSIIYGLMGIEEAIDGQLAAMFVPRGGTYSLNGDALSITVDGATEAFTRRQ